MVLAANLRPADRTALALRLRHNDIDFTLGTDSITVASRESASAHALLQSSPGFSGGSEDFSLFDHSTMGQSDFDEQVNYQRSLQGELERTIMDIRGIDSARVMLAMGRPSPFAMGPAEAERASVMLTTAPGATVDTDDGGGDRASGGDLGARARARLASRSPATTARCSIPRRNTTASWARRCGCATTSSIGSKSKVVGAARPHHGRGSLRGAGGGRCRRLARHQYRQIVRKRRPGDRQRGAFADARRARRVAAGFPGLTSNLPIANPNPEAGCGCRAAAGAEDDTSAKPRDLRDAASQHRDANPSTDDMSRKDIVNYQPSSRETNTITAPVRIKRISVAAVLDGTYDGGHFKPLDDERLKSIKDLVAAAVGADLERGDSSISKARRSRSPMCRRCRILSTQLRSLMADPVHLYERDWRGLSFS